MVLRSDAVRSGSAGYLDGIGGETFRQRAPVLLGQDRCWGQHGHLLARRDGLEDGPNRHFGFAETDISADETIHGLLFFHVPFHIGRGLELIGGEFVGEGFFEFALPGPSVGKAKPLACCRSA